MGVPFAVKNSATEEVLQITREHTVKKSHMNVLSAVKGSAEVIFFNDI